MKAGEAAKDQSGPSSAPSECVYLLCPRFVPAQALKKRLESFKTLCRVSLPDSPDDFLDKAESARGLFVVHVDRSTDLAFLAQVISRAGPGLAEGRLGAVVIARTSVQQIKNHLSRYRDAKIFPLTVQLSELEVHILSFMKKLRGSRPEQEGDKNLSVLRYSSNSVQGSYAEPSADKTPSSGKIESTDLWVIHGEGQKKAQIVPQDQSASTKGAMTPESANATPNRPVNLKWDQNGPVDPSAQSGSASRMGSFSATETGPDSLGKVKTIATRNPTGGKIFQTAGGPKAQPFSAESGGTGQAAKAPPAGGSKAVDGASAATAATPDQSPFGALFQMVQSSAQRKKFLEDCVESRAGVVLAQGLSENKIVGQFYRYDQESNVMRCLLKGAPEDVQAFRDRINPDKPIVFGAALRQSRLLMSATEISWVSGVPATVEFSVPEKIYFVQRRQSFRLVLFPDVSNLVRFSIRQDGGGETFSMPLYDISDGGLALLATETEAQFLKARDNIFFVDLQVEEIPITCGHLVRRHITPVPLGNGDQRYRVGYQFLDLDPALKNRLSEYVERLCQDYLSQFFASKNDP